MKRIFADLYRFDSKPRGKSGRVSHSYLLIREKGNLLVCNRLAPVTDHLDEIEALGGVDTQLIPHYKAAQKGAYHDILHDRFGCKLCYHDDERKMLRTKTKCPQVTFGDEGLKIGRDFEAIHFPNKMQTGTCLFRWRYRGKRYLFTDGVVSRDGDTWDLRFTPDLWPEKLDRFARLTGLDVEVLLPGGTPAGQDSIIKLSTHSREAFQEAIGRKIQPRQSALKEGATPKRLRVVTNYVSYALRSVLENSGPLEIDKMKVHGNCALPLLFTYLEGADVMNLNNFRRKFRTHHKFLQGLRDHVEQGGGLVLSESRPVCGDEEIARSHPFPEIGRKDPSSNGSDQESIDLVVQSKHPVTRGLKVGTRFSPATFFHKDHRHYSYEGASFEPGPNGKVLVRNVKGAPVLIVGEVGKGRVVMSGFFYGGDMPVEDEQRKICENAIRWVSEVE